MKNNNQKVRRLTIAAILTAIVIVMQYLSMAIRFGTFSVTLAIIPIVIGGALLGWKVGAWLGFVFAAIVMLSGDAGVFYAIHPIGTLVTVFAKGILAGLISALVYQLLAKKNDTLALIAAALCCPVVNTGVFLIGCRVFFWDTIISWGTALGYESAAAYAILGLVGANFLFELGGNAVLSPVICRLVKLWQKT